MDQYKIITMNTAGPSGVGYTSRRKQIIENVVVNEKPDFLLVQEFKWTKFWPGGYWDDFNFFGHEEAKLIYDVNKFEVTPLNGTELRTIIDNKFPTYFNPLPRMCICRVESKGVPHVKFVCASWHGMYRGYTLATRTEKFQNLLNFLKIISDNERLPLLICGDFNLNIDIAKQNMLSCFQVCDYNPLGHRDGRVVDYFIVKNFEIKDVHPIDVTKYQVEEPYQVLDHDPISCIIDTSSTVIGSAPAFQPQPFMVSMLPQPIPVISEPTGLPTQKQYCTKSYNLY